MTEMQTQPRPIPVHVMSIDTTSATPRPKPVYRATYQTFVLNSANPVQEILPQDSRRVIAHVMAIDNDIVIGNSQADAGNANNVVASTPNPIGTLVPSKTTAGAIVLYPVLDNDVVYAGATTVASSTRVSVNAVYRV